jgi:YD repeat-containing protein
LRTFVTKMLLAATMFVSTTSHGQTTQAYRYDALGRLVHVDDGRGIVSSYQIDAAGNRRVVKVANAAVTWFEAENMSHDTGHPDADGWAVGVNERTNAYAVWGPHTTNVPVGARTALWNMMIDVNGPDAFPIIRVDVYDATAGRVLAVRDIPRNGWAQRGVYQTFSLPFTLDRAAEGHAIEIRALYIGFAYVRIDKVGYY